jgi:predicted dinucleotide-binding enzyme
LARTVRRADCPVVIANSRGPESLKPVVDALGAGITAGTTEDAARCSIVALAVPWANVHDALAQGGGPLAGHNLVRMPAPWE